MTRALTPARKLSAALVWALLLPACPARPPAAPPPQAQAAAERPAAPPVAMPLVGRFSGTLPCSACAGIETELALGADWSGAYRYRLRERYLGAGAPERVVNSAGTWTKRRGIALDPTALVYELVPDGAEPPRCYLVLDERRIRQLDSNCDPIDPSDAHTLTRADGR
ncbi:MAG: copper resistance protein NlpE [Candidatus Binatia bacterium]